MQSSIPILESHEWDLSAAVDEITALFDDPAVDAADARLDAFDVEVCGIEPVDEPADDPQDGNASPYCQASFALNNEPDDGIPFGDPAGVEEYYDDLLASLASLHAVVPEELKPHLDVLGETFSTFCVILEQCEFDFTAAGPDLDAYQADVEAEFDAAADVLDAHDENVCGIVF
ncbi:MAG: hypothetical protein P8J50_06580 [Acidimicrobiales bacterium]|nr:hypothetical protein [Acidimicrobiales bacterium]